MRSAAINERLLHRVQLISVGNAFNCFNRSAIDLGHRHETAIHDCAVDDYAASATFTLAATFLGAGQMQLLAQHVEQTLHRESVDRSLLTVNRALDLFSCVGRRHFQVALPLLLMPKVKHIMLSMLDWADCRHVERSDNKLSGAWVFRGTRVPVRALFENLESGASINEFLEWFPGVTLEQAVAVLAHAEQSLAQV